MTKKFILFLIIILTFLFCLPVNAQTDVNYNGPLDSFSGLPTQSEEDVTASTGIVPISKGVAYDFAQGEYMIYLDDAATAFVYSNIVSDMITTEPVSFSGDAISQAELYLNGELVASPKLDNITQSGEYVLQIKSGANVEGLLVRFTIISGATSRVNSYSLPQGFVVNKVMMDGETIPWNSTYAEMMEEGNYEISYRCNANKKEYNLRFAVDKTPPTLALSAVVDGKANGPVRIDDLEPNAAIHIALEDKTIPYAQELTTSGNYMITITDAAQNSNKYQFTILIYFNSNSYILLAVVIAGIVALYAYIVIIKKRMRIC